MAELHPSEVYLKERFRHVRGMSSKTAAVICCRLVRDQTEQGIRGAMVEIGVYEGRFFIGPALCMLPDEPCIAIDTFTWPDEGVRDRFLANCAAAGLDPARVTAEKISSGQLTPAALHELTGGSARFIHVDGGHNYDAVAHDLRLAKQVLHPNGLLCLDDVLHPQYPDLTVAVADFLKSSPKLRLFAVIDRESFPASCKFLVCHSDQAEVLKASLMRHFPDNVMRQRSSFFDDQALILSPIRD